MDWKSGPQHGQTSLALYKHSSHGIWKMLVYTIKKGKKKKVGVVIMDFLKFIPIMKLKYLWFGQK